MTGEEIDHINTCCVYFRVSPCDIGDHRPPFLGVEGRDGHYPDRTCDFGLHRSVGGVRLLSLETRKFSSKHLAVKS
jgi:hypothetical protein